MLQVLCVARGLFLKPLVWCRCFKIGPVQMIGMGTVGYCCQCVVRSVERIRATERMQLGTCNGVCEY